MGEDLAVVGARARHGVRAVLAHADAVAVAVDGEGEAAVGCTFLRAFLSRYRYGYCVSPTGGCRQNRAVSPQLIAVS